MRLVVFVGVTAFLLTSVTLILDGYDYLAATYGNWVWITYPGLVVGLMWVGSDDEEWQEIKDETARLPSEIAAAVRARLARFRR